MYETVFLNICAEEHVLEMFSSDICSLLFYFFSTLIRHL